jgi:RNA polymerase sigma-70 factor (ECF subfamily)
MHGLASLPPGPRPRHASGIFARSRCELRHSGGRRIRRTLLLRNAAVHAAAIQVALAVAESNGWETTMPELSEQEIWVLLDAVVAGDERSLSTLYQCFSRRIYAFAMRPLRDAHEAEQVVIDTMYEVWRQAARFDRKCRFSTWVLGIARNKVLHALRGRLPQYEDLIALQDSLASDEDDPSTQVALRQQRAHLDACVSRLPALQRECMELVLRQDLPLADIAQRQGCPENTVKTRLFKARNRLRGAFRQMLEARRGDPADGTDALPI